MLYTVQPVLTTRSVQWRKAFWALPAVDLHMTQVLQGLIASRKLTLQPCAVQACPSHWLTRAMCSRSEHSQRMTPHSRRWTPIVSHPEQSHLVTNVVADTSATPVWRACLPESGPCAVHCTTSSHYKVSSMEESFLGTSSCRSPHDTGATGTHCIAQIDSSTLCRAGLPESLAYEGHV